RGPELPCHLRWAASAILTIFDFKTGNVLEDFDTLLAWNEEEVGGLDKKGNAPKSSSSSIAQLIPCHEGCHHRGRELPGHRATASTPGLMEEFWALPRSQRFKWYVKYAIQ
ncbi:hypothetical protein HK405_015670, partial [Cladochytrium tenue]